MPIPANEVRPTRYRELGYAQSAPNLWRIASRPDGNASDDWQEVGPHYRTKTELLADLDRYAASYGCAGTSAVTAVTVLTNRQVVELFRDSVTKDSPSTLTDVAKVTDGRAMFAVVIPWAKGGHQALAFYGATGLVDEALNSRPRCRQFARIGPDAWVELPPRDTL